MRRGGPAGEPGCDVKLVVKGWVRKIEHELLGECIRHSRMEDNVSEVSNSSGLDHFGQLQPRVSMRAAFWYVNLAAEAPVRLCWKMSVTSPCRKEWGDCGVSLRMDPCSCDGPRRSQSRQRLLDSTGDLVCS